MPIHVWQFVGCNLISWLWAGPDLARANAAGQAVVLSAQNHSMMMTGICRVYGYSGDLVQRPFMCMPLFVQFGRIIY